MENKCVSVLYADQKRKLSSWPRSEDDFFPSFDSARILLHKINLLFDYLTMTIRSRDIRYF